MSTKKVVLGSVKRKVVASDLQEERDKTTFDQQELKVMFSGGKDMYEKRTFYLNLVLKHKDELCNHHRFHEMSISEQQEDLWRRIRFIQVNYPHIWTESAHFRYPYFSWYNIFQGLVPGVGLHYSMFQAAVNAMGNEEQKSHWLDLIANHKILGCYAQTELGHGSDVARLETTATLDKSTDEFVIHSPTITATKMWPGDLGRYTSHALIFARLKIDENDYSVHPFMVQLRDLQTWKHIKGVKTGDLGPKFGYNSKDNGWAIFDHVRIPRVNMMMGLAEVEKDGTFSVKGDMRVLYSTMMLIRTSIVCDSVNLLYRSLQIALRYAAVRRQFASINGSKLERKIIDYQTLQHELTPVLAMAAMQGATSLYFRNQFKLMMDEVKVKNFDRLDVLHHLLSGFKSYYSDEVMTGVEKCRRSAGGAGYASFSGFTELMSLASPIVTYEGENTVMSLQATRYVFKLVKIANKEKNLPFPFGYIAKMDSLLSIKGKGTTVEELLDLSVIEQALSVRSVYQIRETQKQIQASKEPKQVQENEVFAQTKLNMVRAHMKAIGFFLFLNQIEECEFQDKNIKPLLTDLAKIVALKSLIEDCGAVFDAEFFAPSAFQNMKGALDILIKKMRPHLIPIMESFSVPDEIMPSSIGNSYGDIYEQQLEWAMNSRLNREDKNGVPKTFQTYIKPFLHDEIPLNAKL